MSQKMNKILLIILKTAIGAIVALSVTALIVSVFIFVGPYVQTLSLVLRYVLAIILCAPFVVGLCHKFYELGNSFFKDKV